MRESENQMEDSNTVYVVLFTNIAVIFKRSMFSQHEPQIHEKKAYKNCPFLFFNKMKYYKSPSLQGGWLVSRRHPYSCAHSLDSWSAQTRKWNIYVIFRKQGHACWPPGIIVTTGILLVQACRGPLTANGSAAS